MDIKALSGEVEGLIKGIGRAFLFASYLPALVFVALHQYAILPALGVSDSILPAVSLLPGEWPITLLLSAFLAMLLVSLNTLIVKFYEGLLPWQQRFLLRPWQRANERRSEKLYGDLRGLRMDYRKSLQQLAGTREGEAREREALYDHLDKIGEEIRKTHERIEEKHEVQTLPTRAQLVCPTALGNAFAVAEEYPLDRYGMDGVLFWPRLRQVVDSQLLQMVDNLKMFLDFELNVSILGLILGVEAAIVGIRSGAVGWWVAAGLAWVASWLACRAGIRVVRAMGVLLNTCYDFCRKELLKRFGLAQPPNLIEEYAMWVRLGAFLRRGELSHWPGDLTE